MSARRGRGPVTQVIVGPRSELVRCLSSDRILLMDDPLVHFYRATPFATQATTQPKTLCRRNVMFGTHAVPADRATCWRCQWHARRQTGVTYR